MSCSRGVSTTRGDPLLLRIEAFLVEIEAFLVEVELLLFKVGVEHSFAATYAFVDVERRLP